MKRSRSLPFAILAAVCLAVQLPTVDAAIIISGDVDPADAGDWNTWIDGYVGKVADGELEVNGGSELASFSGYIGYEDTGTGVVTVDGAGSTWDIRSPLHVGVSGRGTVNITGGAEVTSLGSSIAHDLGSTGMVTVDGAGSTWNIGGVLYVGRYGTGALNISGGAEVSNSYDAYVGYSSGSTAVVTVDGAGSTWTNSANLLVGSSGRGTLNITGGAEVSTPSTIVGHQPGSTGLIHFGMGGAALTTNSLFASPTQLTGTGTVNTGGLVSDVDLVFDSTASLTQTFVLDSQPGQNVTLNLDITGDPSSNGALGAGWNGHGSLTIRDGIAVYSGAGYIGYHSDSTGVVTVDGAGSTWTNRSGVFVGRHGNGTLNVTHGATAVNKFDGYIGYESTSTGMVTVDGTGSTWTSSYSLSVGYRGSGTLNISGGGVSTAGSTYVAFGAGSTGLIRFGTGGGTLTTRSLFASPAELSGTGTINTRGLISDVDLVFDSTASLTQTLVLDSRPGQNVTVHVDMASDPRSNGTLGAGWNGHGSLTVRDGIAVYSDAGYIGYHSSSTGVVTVDGAGSTWNNSGGLSVGRSGHGMLHISGGAVVSNSGGYVGRYSNSTGVVTVDGDGSMWNSGDLYVGHSGTAALSITNGGAVSAASVSVNAESLLAIDGILNAASATVAGTLAGSGTVNVDASDTVTVSGTVAPGGDGVGTLTMGTGTMELETGATVDVQVSLTATEADKIRVSAAGALRLGGMLAVSGVERGDANSWADVTRTIVDREPGGAIGGEFEGVVPAPGDDATSHVGQGAFLREVDYKTTGAQPADTESVELKLFVALGGDSDGDGKVWLSDWAALRANFGNSGIGQTWTDGNFNPWADDKVWLSDWAAMRAHFGNADYTAAGAAAVPEPGTLVMLLSGVAGVVLLVRRRRSGPVHGVRR